jgi:siroheme decarboxylase
MLNRIKEMQKLTELQKKLCSRLQLGLAICERPFMQMANELGIDEKIVLEQAAELKRTGVIRRISAMINHRALGKTSTLAAAHIPHDKLDDVVSAVNSLEGVSHNYLRGHYYNLWFTLQEKSSEEIERVLSALSGRFGEKFYSLPVVQTFKLEVHFDLESQGQIHEIASIRKPVIRNVELSKNEKLILSKLQNELELVSEPFALLSGDGLGQKDVLRIIDELIGRGVIRRVSAVVNHRRLGFVVNVMFVCRIPGQRIIQAGEKLASFRVVSHCYQRLTFEGWPYNLFGMMHGRSEEEIQKVMDEFVECEKPDSFEILPSIKEFKKQPVRHKFD